VTARPKPRPDRVEPVHGQRLAASDLSDLLDLADHQRRRHVRALHATWGIAAGLEVFQERERVTLVGPGIAYDVCGRVLALRVHAELPTGAARERAQIIALRAAASEREPAAELRVVDEDEIELGIDVPLARLPAGEGPPELGVRRHARSAAPVTVAAGRVRPGRAIAAGFAHDWGVLIDMSKYRFDRLPLYVATVATPRPGARPAGVEVVHEAVDHLLLRVRRARAGEEPNPAVVRNPDTVTWMAVLLEPTRNVGDPHEPSGPCPPGETRGEP